MEHLFDVNIIYCDKRVTINAIAMRPGIICIYWYNNPLRECFSFALREEAMSDGIEIIAPECVCMAAKYPL